MNSLCDENCKNQCIFLRLCGKVSLCIDASYWNGFLKCFSGGLCRVFSLQVVMQPAGFVNMQCFSGSCAYQLIACIYYCCVRLQVFRKCKNIVRLLDVSAQ